MDLSCLSVGWAGLVGALGSLLRRRLSGKAAEESQGSGGTALSFVGGPFLGQDKWLGGALGSDGCIYGVPGCAEAVLKIDPHTGETTTIGGPFKGRYKWLRGISAGDGCIYCIPSWAERVLKITPSTGEVTCIGGLLPGEWKWHGAVLAGDGCIYGIPSNAETVLRIDPSSGDVTTIGGPLRGTHKWYGGLLGSDGCVYGIPQCADAVLKIDPRTLEVSTIGSLPPGGWKWHGGVAGSDGCLYGLPNHADAVLRIVPATGEVTTIGGPLKGGRNREGGKYEGATSLELKLSPRSNYRSHQGLMELKEQIGLSPSPTREDDSPAPKIALAPVPKRRLAAGFCHGDAVQSLVSRLRRGSRVLELGHEGTAVGASRGGGGGSEEGARLLVQFRPGFDWYLALPQVCSASSYAAARSAGLPGGFSWGTRVQSLVTYLSPPGAKKEIWLGDSGTVVGPGLVKGKLAVRFDDARGEWSIWPSTICQAEDYDTLVTERLPGSFCRGDRVRALGSCRGSRNNGGPSKGSLTIEKGEEGTVVGPGHASGHLLVHFDSDERVWSMVPTQVVLANSGYTSVV